MYLVPFQDGPHQLGLSCSAFNGEARPPILKSVPEPIEVATGSNTFFSLELVRSCRRVYETLFTEASASGSWLVGSASGGGSFFKESSISETSVNLLVTVRIDSPNKTLPKNILQMDPKAEKLFLSDGDAFMKDYGPFMITGFELGSLLVGLITIETNSSVKRQEIEASVGGSYFTFSASGSFQQKLEQVTQGLNVKVAIFQLGVNPALPIPETLDKLIERAVNFPEATRGFEQRIYTVLERVDSVFARGNTSLEEMLRRDMLDYIEDVKARHFKFRDEQSKRLSILDRLTLLKPFSDWEETRRDGFRVLLEQDVEALTDLLNKTNSALDQLVSRVSQGRTASFTRKDYIFTPKAEIPAEVEGITIVRMQAGEVELGYRESSSPVKPADWALEQGGDQRSLFHRVHFPNGPFRNKPKVQIGVMGFEVLGSMGSQGRNHFNTYVRDIDQQGFTFQIVRWSSEVHIYMIKFSWLAFDV